MPAGYVNANYGRLQRMSRADRLKLARQQQRLARAANARSGYRTVARTRGVYGQGEMKYYDTSYAPTAIGVVSSTWASTMADPTTVNCLLAPTVGSAINQRIGREIKVFKIKIRGQVTSDAQTLQSAGDNGNHVRIMLVQDMQTNAAQMTGQQLMEGVGSSTRTINAFQSLANFGRFKVLRDKKIVLSNANLANDTGSTGGLVQSGMKRTFKISHTFRKPVSVRFNATNGGSIADIVDNSFHIVCGSDNTGMAVELCYVARVCYKE